MQTYITAGQKITVTQVLSVSSDASFSFGYWTVELIGDGLSGALPKSGKISIPDAGPHVIMTKAPEGLLRAVGEGPATGDSMKFKNVGTMGTRVILSPGLGLLFDFNGSPANPPLSLPLDAGEEVTVQISEHGVGGGGPGTFLGVVSATGPGVDPSLQTIPLQLLIRPRPTATPTPQPAKNRVDQSAPAGGQNPTVSVTFTNTGPGAAEGSLFSDAPWVSPSDPSFSLKAGESKDATFNIDVAKQQQMLAAIGGTASLTARLIYRFLVPGSSKAAVTSVKPLGDPPGTSSVSVTLVSTVTPPANNATIPPLTGIHEQLFLAGVGHVQGSVGLFISDLAIFPQAMRGNTNFRSLALDGLDLYYTPLGGGTSRKASVANLAPPTVAALGDLVSTVYGDTTHVGSLQIRTPGFQAGEGAVGVNANVFNVSGKTGTFGTSIPVFKFGSNARRT